MKQILVLLQEEMLRNTFRTLRKIEAFLSIPCFDYGSVAVVTDSDHPPQRKPKNIKEKVSYYFITQIAEPNLSKDTE